MLELSFSAGDDEPPSRPSVYRPHRRPRQPFSCVLQAKRCWDELSEDAPSPRAVPQRPEDSALVLIDRLPPLSVLEADAVRAAKRARHQALQQAALDQAAASGLPDPPPPTVPTLSSSSTNDGRSEPATVARPARPAAKRAVQPWELLRAIERKDVATVMAARDYNFRLLIDKIGGTTPLLHCLRLGASHRDVAIMLVGALSRYINSVPNVPPDKATKATLVALQANLKLAVTASLATNQTELVSSYLQALVMAQGDKVLRDMVHSVSLALRVGRKARPVRTAGDAIRAFATAELRSLAKTDLIASVEDYLGNATADLVVMGLWNIVTDSVPGDPLPLFAFARDDRVLKAFSDRIDAIDAARYRKLPKALRSTIDLTRRTLEPRAVGFREKVEQLAGHLDDPV